MNGWKWILFCALGLLWLATDLTGCGPSQNSETYSDASVNTEKTLRDQKLRGIGDKG